jgi:CHASE2 domain-containing sensor protein
MATHRIGEEPQAVLDGRYRLEQRIGEGATGIVYRALHLGLRKRFAVKLLKAAAPAPEALARFRREAEALGQLRHPHVVEVTDFGIDTAAGTPYLVLELLEGISLADFCREHGPLPIDRALPLLAAVASALDAAHRHGILHRDLKPGNIWLSAATPAAQSQGQRPHVKVLDFGLAELADPTAETAAVPAPGAPCRPRAGEGADTGTTATGALLGTPLYAAPEIIRGQAASRASDVYSFGVIAYELLAGRPPFQGSTAGVLAGHLEAAPPLPAPAGVPLAAEVWAALQEPLRKEPARRPPDAGEVVRRLRQASGRAAGRVALARWRAVEIPRRLQLAAALAALALLVGLLLPRPAVPAAERWVQNLRLQAAPARPPDPRILLLTFDEASLEEGAPSLGDRADEVGRILDRVFAAGARGVAIDLLLPAKWARSAAFSDLVVRHPETLTLAAFSQPDGRIVGADCAAGLTAAALGPERTSQLFGFVHLQEDSDGVIRRGRRRFRDRAGGSRPSWAARAAGLLTPGLAPRGSPEAPGQGADDPFWLDARIDWPRYARISWRDVPAMLDRSPEVFRGRLVLVGGDFRGSGDDYHRIPHRSRDAEAVSGLTLQALLVDTLAAGAPVREPGRLPVLLAAAVVGGLAAAAVLCNRRVGPSVAALAAATVLYLALSFPAFARAGLLLPISLPVLLTLLTLALALVLRRRLPPAPEVSP